MQNLWRDRYGDYGVTVNTGACGALDSSSILDSRPKVSGRDIIRA